MKLSETSIRRPVLASMISAALVLFGVIGYTRLSVRELPDIDPPIISVSTTLPGANAQVVETAVTDVLEEELSTIQGLRTLSSSSAEENSQIILEFNLDRPVDVAAQDVRDKVSRVRGRLPVDVLEPVIAKQQADAQPFFWLALSSPNYDLMQLSDVADRLVKARLQSLAGVGSAGIFGERRYAMRAWVQPEQLSARGRTVQAGESPIDVAQRIREALPGIQQTLPPGVKLEIAFDGSLFVTHSINDARLTLLIAAILVVLIIFVFLRNLRATIIPGLAIPASIVSTFAIMYFLGFSINNFTLLALTIAIGIVVDDAIIVLENAYRHQEELHEAPQQAAIHGTSEIGFAVIATTIALVAVFTPLGFLRGSTGRLLSEFGIAVAGAVVISGFVALTLTPMLCAYVRRVPHEHGAVFKMLERGFNALADRYAKLPQPALRHRSVQQLVGALFPQLFGLAGIQAFPYSPGALGFSQPVQFVVQNPDLGRLAQAMDTFVTRARAIKGLTNLDTDLRFNKPELRVTFDRDRAEDLGVPVRDVAAALQTFLGGRRVSTFTRNDKLYYVMVQLDPTHRATPSDMSGIYLRGRGQQLVQLGALARVQEGVGPRQINHFNRVPSFTLSASLIPPFAQGEALDSLDRRARRVLPPGSTTALAGDSREFKESGGALYFAFGVALLVVFMVLASQFESLVHPFTVLLAVPLAVAGALATLLGAALLHRPGGTINLYSEIGMVLLIGLVTKNSILLVEYANQLKAKGLDTIAAVLESGRIRLRPILMTSVSTIMGAIPVMVGVGAGSTSRRPLGYAIVGGIFFSTVLTLFVVPVGYVLLNRLTAREPSHVRVARPVEAD